MQLTDYTINHYKQAAKNMSDDSLRWCIDEVKDLRKYYEAYSKEYIEKCENQYIAFCGELDRRKHLVGFAYHVNKLQDLVPGWKLYVKYSDGYYYLRKYNSEYDFAVTCNQDHNQLLFAIKNMIVAFTNLR